MFVTWSRLKRLFSPIVVRYFLMFIVAILEIKAYAEPLYVRRLSFECLFAAC